MLLNTRKAIHALFYLSFIKNKNKNSKTQQQSLSLPVAMASRLNSTLSLPFGMPSWESNKRLQAQGILILTFCFLVLFFFFFFFLFKIHFKWEEGFYSCKTMLGNTRSNISICYFIYVCL